MARVRWTSRAYEELKIISSFYAEIAPLYATRLERQLLASTRQLEIFPRSGRKILESGDEALREILFRGYRIMYHYNDDNDEVEILAVLHSSQRFGD